MMIKNFFGWALGLLFLATLAQADFTISKPGKLLMKENFDGADLPKLFTVGVGDWSIVDHSIRGRQQAADKHTAFRKIYLDHQDVIYQFDMKIEGDAFSQILINYDLSHIAKCVTRVDSVSVFKIFEGKKRAQMAKEGHDPGKDPMKGKWDEKTFAMDTGAVDLKKGKWYSVTIEMIGDQLAMEVDGARVIGQHIGITEKKTNYGFQAGGFEGYVYYDNIRVWEALPLKR